MGVDIDGLLLSIPVANADTTVGSDGDPIDTTNPADFIPVDIGIDHLLGIAG
jgi:hypothetical protein